MITSSHNNRAFSHNHEKHDNKNNAHLNYSLVTLLLFQSDQAIIIIIKFFTPFFKKSIKNAFLHLFHINLKISAPAKHTPPPHPYPRHKARQASRARNLFLIPIGAAL
jgi:hypothetical protein